jgi:tetratricopeptide (TPR) repeat protein
MSSNKLANDIQKALQKSLQIAHPQTQVLTNITVQQSLALIQQALNAGAFEYVLLVCEKIIAVAPKLPQAYLFMARAHLRIGNKKMAKELVSKALKMSVGHAENILHAGQILGDLYETEQSFELIERAYKLSPNDPQVLTFYAVMLIKKGQSDIAVKCLKKAIRINPNFTGAYLMLALEDPAYIDDVMLVNINRLIDTIKTPSVQQAELLFAGAKKYAKLGDMASEFAYLDRANRIIRNRYTWTWKNELRHWQEISAKFTPTFVARIQKNNHENLQPIIFATLPRSGTTLAEQIISSHSQVCAAGESNLFHGVAIETAIHSWGESRYWHPIDEQNADDYLQTYQQRIYQVMEEQHLHKSFVTDKSINNYSSIGVILSAFPNAKVIHCVRDPLAICLSCYQHYFQDGLPYTCNLEDMARMCSLFEEIMKYWKGIFPDRILTLHYADIVNNPEESVRTALNFLNLPWEESCLKFYENKSIVHTASVKQVQNPINNKGLERWKKYETYLQPAINTLIKGLEE